MVACSQTHIEFDHQPTQGLWSSKTSTWSRLKLLLRIVDLSGFFIPILSLNHNVSNISCQWTVTLYNINCSCHQFYVLWPRCRLQYGSIPRIPREVGCHYDGGNEFTGLSDCIGGKFTWCIHWSFLNAYHLQLVVFYFQKQDFMLSLSPTIIFF